MKVSYKNSENTSVGRGLVPTSPSRILGTTHPYLEEKEEKHEKTTPLMQPLVRQGDNNPPEVKIVNAGRVNSPWGFRLVSKILPVSLVERLCELKVQPDDRGLQRRNPVANLLSGVRTGVSIACRWVSNSFDACTFKIRQLIEAFTRRNRVKIRLNRTPPEQVLLEARQLCAEVINEQVGHFFKFETAFRDVNETSILSIGNREWETFKSTWKQVKTRMTQTAPNDNLHYNAASRRTRATHWIHELARKFAMSTYEISMSRKSLKMRGQKAKLQIKGNRGYYSLRDIGTFARAFKDEPTAKLCFMIDVDHFLTTEQWDWLHRFDVVAMYTWMPPSSGFRSDEVEVSYMTQREKWRFVCPGADTLVHSLWDHTRCEFLPLFKAHRQFTCCKISDLCARKCLHGRCVQCLSCIRVLSMSQNLACAEAIQAHVYRRFIHPMGAGRAVIIYYKTAVMHKIDTLLYQELLLKNRLRRLLPTVIKLNDAVEASSLNVRYVDKSYVTVAVDSVPHSVKLPMNLISKLRAMATTMKTLTQAHVNALSLKEVGTEEWKDYDQGDRALISSFINAYVAPVECFTMDIVSYENTELGPVQTTPDKFYATCFTKSVSTVKPCFPEDTKENEIWAVKTRVTDLRAENVADEPTKSQEDEINAFVNSLEIKPHHLSTFEEIIERQNRPTQRSIVLRALSIMDITNNRLKETMQSFMKREAYNRMKNPRVITTMSPATKVMVALIVYSLEDIMKETWMKHHYAFGHPPEKLVKLLVKQCLEMDFCFETDFKSMDGTVSAKTRALVKRIIQSYFNCSSAEMENLAVKLYGVTYGNKVYGKHGLKYEQWFAQASGDMLTSLSNTIINIFIMFVTCLRLGLDRRGLYGGDDGVTFLKGDEKLAQQFADVYTAVAKEYGMTLKLKTIVKGQSFSFLSRIFSPNVWYGDPSNVADLERALPKLHTVVAEPGKRALKEIAIEKCLSLWVNDRHTPGIREFCLRQFSTHGVDPAVALKSFKPGYQTSWNTRWSLAFEGAPHYQVEMKDTPDWATHYAETIGVDTLLLEQYARGENVVFHRPVIICTVEGCREVVTQGDTCTACHTKKVNELKRRRRKQSGKGPLRRRRGQ